MTIIEPRIANWRDARVRLAAELGETSQISPPSSALQGEAEAEPCARLFGEGKKDKDMSPKGLWEL
jgi:hypothetical protein